MHGYSQTQIVADLPSFPNVRFEGCGAFEYKYVQNRADGSREVYARVKWTPEFQRR